MKLNGLYFDCQVDGCAAGTFSAVEFTLEEGLSQLFTLTLTLTSSNPDIDVKTLILHNMNLTVFTDGIPQRQVIGIITEARRGKSGFRQTYYTFTVRPHLWLLTQRQQSRIFHFKTIPEVMNILLQEHGVKFSCDCRDNHSQREFITQKRETDYAFFCRLAAEEGITFWFEVNNGETQCLYTDSFLSVMGGDPLEYNDHPQSSSVGNFAYQINLSAKVTPQRAVGKDRTYLHPRYAYQHEAEQKTIDTGNVEVHTIYDSYARFPDDATGKQMIQYRLEALQRDSEYGEGESNSFQLRPGYYFALQGHPSALLNNKWQVTSVTHHGVLPQSGEEDFSDRAATLTNQFCFISYYKNWRPKFIPKPVADGPEVAEVVGPEGEEIFTNKLGQVKVHFHWNLYDKADENASCWVRVMQGWSGSGYGFYSVPRIGQEVVVSYLDGDIDRPIITGCTYNDVMALPVSLPDNKTQTVIRTQTHKGSGYNELRFEDATNQELLSIHAQKDMNTMVLNNRTTTVMANHTENIVANQTMSIGGEQMNIVQKSQTEAIKQAQTVVIGESKTNFVAGPYIMSSATGIRLVCGESAIEMTPEGQISLSCKNFNFYAEKSGQITALDILDLNMDKSESGIKDMSPSQDDISQMVSAFFSSKAGK